MKHYVVLWRGKKNKQNKKSHWTKEMSSFCQLWDEIIYVKPYRSEKSFSSHQSGNIENSLTYGRPTRYSYTGAQWENMIYKLYVWIFCFCCLFTPDEKKNMNTMSTDCGVTADKAYASEKQAKTNMMCEWWVTYMHTYTVQHWIFH